MVPKSSNSNAFPLLELRQEADGSYSPKKTFSKPGHDTISARLRFNISACFYIMQRDYNDFCKAKICFPFIRVLISKKEKVALTWFYCLSQET